MTDHGITETAPFICSKETPWTPDVTEKLVLHPAAFKTDARDSAHHMCPICGYRWSREP
jgi:hypothetical protein